MIDREARDRLAEILNVLAKGELSEAQLETRQAQRSKDFAIRDIGIHAASLFCEFKINEDGGLVLNEDEQETIKRCILFLRSNREYDWALKHLSFWKALLLFPIATVALVLGAGVFCGLAATWHSAFGDKGFSRTGIGVAVAIMCVVGLGADRLIGRLKGRDHRYWPFYCRRDHENALRRQEASLSL